MTIASQNSLAANNALEIEQEKKKFDQLQEYFKNDFAKVYPDRYGLKTIVVIPSLTMDQEILDKIDGVFHYEERLLCLLMLLRMPRANVVYVSSTVIDPVIIDYYLHLLPGITGYHARQRLHLLSCYDYSQKSLTEKILARPRLIERIKKCIPPDHIAHISCFNVTDMERKLSVKLNIPLYGCDPDLLHWGTKSGSREVFKEVGINLPAGFENLKNKTEIINSLVALKQLMPDLKKAVVKLNDGFSGDGNSIFYYAEKPETNIRNWIDENFTQRLKVVASNLSAEKFIEKFESMGGIVEAFIDGEDKRSPSVQCKIDPLGGIEISSTHDQLLDGESGQVYIGANFPASSDYSVEIAELGKKVAQSMKQKGVLGRFSIDFLSVKEKDKWKHYAVEINLRKGGTTHPFLLLQFLTDGIYIAETGKFITKNKSSRHYVASDNLRSEKIIGTTAHDLIDIAMMHDLHYDSTREEGVMFHLIGALSQFGKLGIVCIGNTAERAQYFYDEAVRILELEC